MADLKRTLTVLEGATSLAPPAGPDRRFTPYVRQEPDGALSLHLLVENLHCPSCIRQIEGAFAADADTVRARVNLTTRRLRLGWDGDPARAEELARRVEKLGYAVTPFVPDELGASRDGEGKRLLRCMAVAGFAAANVMLLSVSVWAGAASDMGPATRAFLYWLSALIALPTVVYAGRPFFSSAWGAVRSRSLNMDVPISVAILLTAAMSLYETATGGQHAYFDACVTLLFILLVGRYLDHGARSKARSAAERLSVLENTVARVVDAAGRLHPVPSRDLAPGVVVAIAQGERIPADGRIVHGDSEVDTSLVTGESLPRAAAAGDDVFAGTINLTGPLRVRVTAAAQGTVLAEIARLMEAAQQSRSRYVRLADRAARLYAPAVHLAALLAFIGWTAVGGLAWQPALMIAVAVLIITCPCALGLAVPAVQVVASGRLMQAGVLVTGGDALERLAAVDHVVLDKTGTLTTGRLTLINRDAIDPATGRLAAGIAAASRHPLCRAIVDAFGPAVAATDATETPGRGLEATLAGERMRLGSRRWCGVAGEPDRGIAPELWLAREGRTPVRFVFEDALRVDAAEFIVALRRLGLSVELLSGDRVHAVSHVAALLGMRDWRGDCAPAGKAQRLAHLRKSGRKVLMIGDGLNDAPALAGAFASISPAAASDISRTAADLIFQGDRLGPVVEAIAVARAARRLVRQNFTIAAVYNLVAVPLAVAGLVTPLIAAVAMSASSIAVTLNALRLRLHRRKAMP